VTAGGRGKSHWQNTWGGHGRIAPPALGSADDESRHSSKPNLHLKKTNKYGEKWFSIWRMKFSHPAMWHHHNIDFARWLHPAMWQVALGWHAIKFAQTSAILEFYIWFWFRPYHHSRHVIATVCVILSKSDHHRQKKMTSCRFSRWRISAILDFRGPIAGLKSAYVRLPIDCGHHGSKLFSFWENRVFCILATDRQTDRQTNKQMNEQMDIIDALSRSRCRERQPERS